MDRIEQLTAKYLDEALSPTEGLDLANHLRADPLAAREFAELYTQDRLLAGLLQREDQRAIDSIMTEIRSEEGAFVSSVMQRVQERPEAGGLERLSRDWAWVQSIWRSWLTWSAFAAVTAIASWYFLFRSVVGQPVLVVTKASWVTVERAGQSISLLDRTRLLPNDLLTLNGTNSAAITYVPEQTSLELTPGTTLELLDGTWGKRLEVRLGRIDANVAPQRPFRPMVLKTPQAEVRVLGTHFSLVVDTNASRLEVTKGKVRFARPGAPSVEVEAGQYAVAATNVTLAALPITGQILHEYWTNRPGQLPKTLGWQLGLTEPADGVEYLTQFETPLHPGNYFGERFRGYLHPPRTGDYTFWIAGNDFSELRLSRDDQPANKIGLASSSDASPRQWTNDRRKQQPAPLTLEAGKMYYIETVQDSQGGEHHLAVAWQGPGIEREVIPGQFLSPFPIKERKAAK